jgi:hypothetical protein
VKQSRQDLTVENDWGFEGSGKEKESGLADLLCATSEIFQEDLEKKNPNLPKKCVF